MLQAKLVRLRTLGRRAPRIFGLVLSARLGHRPDLGKDVSASVKVCQRLEHNQARLNFCVEVAEYPRSWRVVSAIVQPDGASDSAVLACGRSSFLSGNDMINDHLLAERPIS